VGEKRIESGEKLKKGFEDGRWGIFVSKEKREE
jgi:hypothetical protein